MTSKRLHPLGMPNAPIFPPFFFLARAPLKSVEHWNGSSDFPVTRLRLCPEQLDFPEQLVDLRFFAITIVAVAMSHAYHSRKWGLTWGCRIFPDGTKFEDQCMRRQRSFTIMAGANEIDIPTQSRKECDLSTRWRIVTASNWGRRQTDLFIDTPGINSWKAKLFSKYAKLPKRFRGPVGKQVSATSKGGCSTAHQQAYVAHAGRLSQSGFTAMPRGRPRKHQQSAFNRRFEELISEICARFQIKEVRIAEEIGLSLSALNAMITGKSQQPTQQTLKLLKLVFGVEPQWLSNGFGRPFVGDYESEGNGIWLSTQGNFVVADTNGLAAILLTLASKELALLGDSVIRSFAWDNFAHARTLVRPDLKLKNMDPQPERNPDVGYVPELFFMFSANRSPTAIAWVDTNPGNMPVFLQNPPKGSAYRILKILRGKDYLPEILSLPMKLYLAATDDELP